MRRTSRPGPQLLFEAGELPDGAEPNPKNAAAYAGTVEKRAGVLRWTGLLRPLPDRLDWPLKWKKPARIFVGNMTNLFTRTCRTSSSPPSSLSWASPPAILIRF